MDRPKETPTLNSEQVTAVIGDVEATPWIRERLGWLTDWLRFVPATHPRVDCPVYERQYQPFWALGVGERNLALLRHGVFNVENRVNATGSEQGLYSFPGFVQQAGRLPVPEDDVFFCYIRHQVVVEDGRAKCAGDYRLYINDLHTSDE